MTIKDFSKLCGCNPQTLRYYDREGLLKPVKVDEWSGYRYYDEEQAIAFVKIKNLQKAGFSIDEIKELLDKDDTEIYFAFDKKIIEQEKQLQEIKNLQKAYQAEIKDMKQAVLALRDTLKDSMEKYSPVEEFGITEDECEEIKKNLDEYFGAIVKSEDHSIFDVTDFSGSKEEEAAFNKCFNNPDFTTVFERHDWKNVKDFYNELPELADGRKYSFLFRLSPEKKVNTAFASSLLNILCIKNQNKRMEMTCNVISSDDGKNHFWCREDKK